MKAISKILMSIGGLIVGLSPAIAQSNQGYMAIEGRGYVQLTSSEGEICELVPFELPPATVTIEGPDNPYRCRISQLMKLVMCHAGDAIVVTAGNQRRVNDARKQEPPFENAARFFGFEPNNGKWDYTDPVGQQFEAELDAKIEHCQQHPHKTTKMRDHKPVQTNVNVIVAAHSETLGRIDTQTQNNGNAIQHNHTDIAHNNEHLHDIEGAVAVVSSEVTHNGADLSRIIGYTDTLESGQATISGYTADLSSDHAAMTGDHRVLMSEHGQIIANQGTISGHTSGLAGDLDVLNAEHDRILANQTTMLGYVSTIPVNHAVVMGTLTPLSASVSATRASIHSVQGTVGTIAAEVSDIATEVSDIATGVGEIKTDTDEIIGYTKDLSSAIASAQAEILAGQLDKDAVKLIVMENAASPQALADMEERLTALIERLHPADDPCLIMICDVDSCHGDCGPVIVCKIDCDPAPDCPGSCGKDPCGNNCETSISMVSSTDVDLTSAVQSNLTVAALRAEPIEASIDDDLLSGVIGATMEAELLGNTLIGLIQCSGTEMQCANSQLAAAVLLRQIADKYGRELAFSFGAIAKMDPQMMNSALNSQPIALGVPDVQPES